MHESAAKWQFRLLEDGWRGLRLRVRSCYPSKFARKSFPLVNATPNVPLFILYGLILSCSVPPEVHSNYILLVTKPIPLTPQLSQAARGLGILCTFPTKGCAYLLSPDLLQGSHCGSWLLPPAATAGLVVPWIEEQLPSSLLSVRRFVWL